MVVSISHPPLSTTSSPEFFDEVAPDVLGEVGRHVRKEFSLLWTFCSARSALAAFISSTEI